MKKKKTGPMTAGELMAELESDPQWVAERDKREQESRERGDRLRREQKPLLKDLAQVGYELESVWDLVNTPTGYPTAVPVLIEHLQRSYHRRIREGIVRALTVPFARDAVPVLLQVFRSAEPDLRWVIGNALSIAATAEDCPAILPLIADKAYGESRDMLVHVIAKGPDAVDRLIAYLDDPELAVESIIALGNLKESRALEHIKPFREHPDSWVREKVQRAVRKLENRQQSRHRS